MGIISWVLVGLLAGWLARKIMKGEPEMGTLQTIILGILGGIVGGYIGNLLGLGTVNGFNVGSLLLATAGAYGCLWIYKKYIA